IGTDWFNNNADVAFNVGNRASNRSEEGYTNLYRQENSAIHINESFFSLAPADAARTLTSVTITNTGGDRMAVFALSGELVPEPSSIMLLGAGALMLIRRRR
ncbi:MAG: PEP-CTERM sorting domain-containing protein, partial [Phycisphaerales bacterium]|nr:PEP-CTERM sorting domain-containing protein [Phycisphaerales bacterium]